CNSISSRVLLSISAALASFAFLDSSAITGDRSRPSCAATSPAPRLSSARRASAISFFFFADTLFASGNLIVFLQELLLELLPCGGKPRRGEGFREPDFNLALW